MRLNVGNVFALPTFLLLLKCEVNYLPYKKLNIKNGQILNQAHLAHFEQGISENSTNIEEIQNKIKDIEDNGGG